MTPLEWAQILLRWFHVVAAITWIGQTYLFVWMERHMRPVADSKTGATEDLWMVHGGGFWYLQKLTVPERMPQSLLWFKWESGLTWISGFLLLVAHFYAVDGSMVDRDHPMAHGAAVALGAGALVAGWIIYNLVWRSPLGRNELVGAAVSLGLVMLAAWGLRQGLDSRSAFLHVGTMLATIMAANVWLCIIPGQRKVVAARAAGLQPDESLLVRGRRASRHNTYMSIPVVLMMLNQHVTGVVGHPQAWAFIGGLTLVGWIAARLLRGPA